MATVNDVFRFLSEFAPIELAEPWDNVGLLVGHKSVQVKRILVSLDITDAVIDEACNISAELIVSHHPVIWEGYKFVTDQNYQQERVMRLIENQIAAICMHTNLDKTVGGVDDTLVEKLELIPEQKLGADGIGRISRLREPVPLNNFLPRIKQMLQAKGLRYHDAGKTVMKIATCCGAGGDYLYDAVKAGCDTFITGDVKHNIFVDAEGYQINLVDAGHFTTENQIVNKIAKELRQHFTDIGVAETDAFKQIEQFYV